MAGKRVAQIYSEETMLANAKALNLQVIQVTSMIKESGRFNEYVDSIKYIICGRRTIGVVHKNGKVDELCAVKHNVKLNRKEWKYTDTPKDKMASMRSGNRFGSNFRGLDSNVPFSRVMGVIEDIIGNNGVTRQTYIGLQVNHMDCSGGFGYDADESEDNLEVVTDTNNSRAGKASYKLLKYGKWISFSADDTDFIDYVLDKDFDINDFNKKYPKSNLKYLRTLTREFVRGQGVKTLDCYKK